MEGFEFRRKALLNAPLEDRCLRFWLFFGVMSMLLCKYHNTDVNVSLLARAKC